jgi:hypothetical protein
MSLFIRPVSGGGIGRWLALVCGPCSARGARGWQGVRQFWLAPGLRGLAGDDLVVVPVLGPVEGVAVLLGFFEVFDVHPGQEGQCGRLQPQ